MAKAISAAKEEECGVSTAARAVWQRNIAGVIVVTILLEMCIKPCGAYVYQSMCGSYLCNNMVVISMAYSICSLVIALMSYGGCLNVIYHHLYVCNVGITFMWRNV